MYMEKLTNKYGDEIYVGAKEGSKTMYLQVFDVDSNLNVIVNLDRDNFLKLRQMLTEVFTEMRW